MGRRQQPTQMQAGLWNLMAGFLSPASKGLQSQWHQQTLGGHMSSASP